MYKLLYVCMCVEILLVVVPCTQHDSSWTRSRMFCKEDEFLRNSSSLDATNETKILACDTTCVIGQLAVTALV
jgi:hypothetical protein